MNNGPDAADRRRHAVIAGHRGDLGAATAALDDADASVREAAVGAVIRLTGPAPDLLARMAADPDVEVRCRVAEAMARAPHSDTSNTLIALLHDPAEQVIEVAAWCAGEHVTVTDVVLERLIDLAQHHDDALVRESAAAALGAIGDERGLPAILAACKDKPAVRRRAVLALASFDGPEVDAAIDAALTDRDWQVRQSAEDLRR